MSDIISLIDPTFLNSIFRFVTPILFAALGGLLCDRVGIFNISLEGLMLTGTFAAVVGIYFTGSSLLGVLFAMVAGGTVASIYAVLVVYYRADMIVMGIATNILASGLTVFLLRTIFNIKGTFNDPAIIGLEKIRIPLIHHIPLLGPLLSNHTWLVYASWAAVITTFFFLFRHALGMRIRGIGERPEASASLGINVRRYQFIVLVVAGMLSAAGGAQLSLGSVNLFVENMSAGRGWIAVVAVMLGQSHPYGVFGAALLFGFVDSLSFRIQGMGLPQQFTEMLPYVITLLALFLIAFERKRRNGIQLS